MKEMKDVATGLDHTNLNDGANDEKSDATEENGAALGDSVEFDNHTYGAIFDFDEKTITREKEKSRHASSQHEAS